MRQLHVTKNNNESRITKQQSIYIKLLSSTNPVEHINNVTDVDKIALVCSPLA